MAQYVLEIQYAIGKFSQIKKSVWKLFFCECLVWKPYLKVDMFLNIQKDDDNKLIPSLIFIIFFQPYF